MKAVILAAGLGSRLGDKDLPKPLTLLDNGQSILQLQIRSLTRHMSIHDILIVVGFRKELIMDRHPDLLFVYNPSFAEENTAKSLLRALHKVQEDVLWINGDVIFHPSVLQDVITLRQTGMVVNAAVVDEESVKYRTDKQGSIVEVSKTVLQPEGEALGMNFWKSADLALLKTELIACRPNDYFEKGIEFCIQKGLVVKPIQVSENLCAEIDFPEDLKKANQMLSQWSNT
jgi:choline kinase